MLSSVEERSAQLEGGDYGTAWEVLMYEKRLLFCGRAARNFELVGKTLVSWSSSSEFRPSGTRCEKMSGVAGEKSLLSRR